MAGKILWTVMNIALLSFILYVIYTDGISVPALGLLPFPLVAFYYTWFDKDEDA